MARKRKSLIRGKPLDLVIAEAALDRTLGLQKALKMYALKYRAANPDWLGWVAFMTSKLQEKADELMRLSEKERAVKVMEMVSALAEEWRKMPEDQKAEWIKRGERAVAELKSEYEQSIREAEELEKLVSETMKVVEEVVAEVVR